MTLFDSCCADIESAYRQLGHQQGWRFLSGPKANLSPATQIAFISLNPGGDSDSPDHPCKSQELGSSFLVESWEGKPAGQAKLQVQVGTMFKLLAERMGKGDHKTLMNKTLMGHFIPFRSPSLAQLANKKASLDLSDKLWRRVFEHISPRTIITIDRHAFEHVRKIVRDAKRGKLEQHLQLPTGWGKYSADVVRFGTGQETVTLARLPHLSRFTIFTSQKCQHEVQRVMDAIVNAP